MMEIPLLDEDFEPINPMIAAALDKGEDATGLCTVRECTALLREMEMREIDLAFEMGGKTYLVRVQILQVTSP